MNLQELFCSDFLILSKPLSFMNFIESPKIGEMMFIEFPFCRIFSEFGMMADIFAWKIYRNFFFNFLISHIISI